MHSNKLIFKLAADRALSSSLITCGHDDLLQTSAIPRYLSSSSTSSLPVAKSRVAYRKTFEKWIAENNRDFAAIFVLSNKSKIIWIKLKYIRNCVVCQTLFRVLVCMYVYASMYICTNNLASANHPNTFTNSHQLCKLLCIYMYSYCIRCSSLQSIY